MNLRHFAVATFVPVAVMIAAMALKPLWRDEYWSLFFSDPSLPLAELFGGRWRNEVHPPLYYVLLHGWRHVFDHPFALRLMSPLLLIVTGALTLRHAPRSHRRTVTTFLLVCLGSYWVIYFATEIRPYTLLFCLTGLSVLLTREWVQADPPGWAVCLCWTTVGAMMALTHYFGALWFACLGLVIGLDALRARRIGRFLTVGALTIAALVPLIGWLVWSLPVLDLSDEMTQRSAAEKFAAGMQQLSRGLVVKTFLSNPVVTLLGVAGLIGAIRWRDHIGGVLLYAALLSVGLAFALHMFAVELIKERAFIVIMPAILYILAARLAKRQSRWTAFVPWAAALTPLLFAPEYFKNREGIPDMQAYLARYAGACDGQPVLAYYRQNAQRHFYPDATRSIMKGWDADPVFAPDLLDARQVRSAPATDCPVRAVGVLLSRQPDEQADMDAVFSRAGLDIQTLVPMSFGQGRNRIWIDPDAEDGGQTPT
ncbi:hypothetical protein [uncultured Algimonas sp.]|uniref:hypothetical protein n=1 Tax=uncultured Algimonas sp. TaxID=1547920 RepID=UPI00260424BB|nr:hypothetical protein [uncultured Algimonas sp.]